MFKRSLAEITINQCIGTTGPQNQLNHSVLSEVVSGLTPSLLLF